MPDEKTEEMWKWIDRPLDEEFWRTAGHLSKNEVKKRYAEIPETLKPLAFTTIALAYKNKEMGRGGTSDHACLLFRIMLFDVYRKLKDEKGLDLHLPHTWFMDGVMIEPEWIVRITNGIIGWVCDNSVNSKFTGGCGFNSRDECRFYGVLK